MDINVCRDEEPPHFPSHGHHFLAVIEADSGMDLRGAPPFPGAPRFQVLLAESM